MARAVAVPQKWEVPRQLPGIGRLSSRSEERDERGS